MFMRRLSAGLLVLTLSLALAGSSEARHRWGSSIGYSTYSYGQPYLYGGYSPVPTYNGSPVGYIDTNSRYYDYGSGYQYAPVSVGYGSPYYDDLRRRDRRRTRNVLLGVGAAVAIGAILSR